MPTTTENRFVITGGPCAGKTTLIDALRGAGFVSSAEAGRQIIRDQTRIEGEALPWRDRALYAEVQLAWELRAYDALAGHDGPVFFDRGIPDVIGYLRLEGLPVPAHMLRAAEDLRYARRVFLCPPWPEIFARDAERRQTPEVAERTCASMIETYAGLGYELVEVPKVPIEARLRFILDSVGNLP